MLTERAYNGSGQKMKESNELLSGYHVSGSQDEGFYRSSIQCPYKHQCRALQLKLLKARIQVRWFVFKISKIKDSVAISEDDWAYPLRISWNKLESTPVQWFSVPRTILPTHIRQNQSEKPFLTVSHMRKDILDTCPTSFLQGSTTLPGVQLNAQHLHWLHWSWLVCKDPRKP